MREKGPLGRESDFIVSLINFFLLENIVKFRGLGG
jgi:hypothetical protein